MIYTTGGIKGGSGKSTVATNLVVLLTGLGRDVLLVDADDQETSTDFTALREERTDTKAGYTAIQLSGTAILKQIPKLAERYQDIVVDTGGRDTDSQRAALTVSDVYLVPFKPRSFDIWTIEKVQSIVEQAQAINQKLRAFVFLNMADPRGEENFEAAELLQQSESLEFVKSTLGHRKAFSNAAANGLGVLELKGDEKQLFHLLTLEFINDYYDNNSWKINQKTNIDNQNLSQIETWSKLDFKNYLTKNYSDLEKENSDLKKIQTKKYKEIFDASENL
ncbi:MAG: hypothetical protein EOP45_21970, partial [Sphingobacteriaceae bacterium]